MLRSMAVPLIDGVAPFEFGLLCEAFGIDRTEEGVPLVDFRARGEVPNEPVATSGRGVSLTPQHGLDALQSVALVALPAGGVPDEYPEKLVRALGGAGATLRSVRGGAFMLGAAGLLDGRRCATHWRGAREFQRRWPEAHVDPDGLFVGDGNIS